MTKWMGLVAGSMAGGVARYALAGVVYRWFGAEFPHGTLVVNLSGCLAMGWLNSLAIHKLLLGENARMLLMVGFCGAFTTFSTFILETSILLKDGEVLRASGNVLLSVVGGLLLFWLGEWLGRTL